jgi:hypothetical protein
MLKVTVNGYFLGKARDLADADALAVGYAAWLVSAGKISVGTIPFEFRERGVVVVSGDIDVSDIPSDDAEPVKGAIGGAANP